VSGYSDWAWQFAQNYTCDARVGLGYANVDSIKLLSATGQNEIKKYKSRSLPLRFVEIEFYSLYQSLLRSSKLYRSGGLPIFWPRDGNSFASERHWRNIQVGSCGIWHPFI